MTRMLLWLAVVAFWAAVLGWLAASGRLEAGFRWLLKRPMSKPEKTIWISFAFFMLAVHLMVIWIFAKDG